MSITLSEPQFDLLREVLEKRARVLLPALEEGGRGIVLRARLKQFQELLGDELTATGLRDDSEPNERGLALEDLIDALSSYK